MMRVLAARSIAIAALAALPACYTSPKPEPEPCTNGQYLHVQNETGGPIDVYAVKGASRSNIGSVGPGQTDLTIPGNDASGVGFVGVASDGLPVVAAFGGQGRAARLEMHPQCYKNPPTAPASLVRPPASLDEREPQGARH